MHDEGEDWDSGVRPCRVRRQRVQARFLVLPQLDPFVGEVAHTPPREVKDLHPRLLALRYRDPASQRRLVSSCSWFAV